MVTDVPPVADRWDGVRAAYDLVAGDYARLVTLDTAETEQDVALLDGFAARVAGSGPVLDAGCGPGRLTGFLSERGLPVTGLDLSEQMVRIARSLHPGLPFVQGSVDALPVRGDSLGGVLAWYSLIHTAPTELGGVLGELLRVLRPGGWLLVAGQSGTGARHLARGYGHELDLTAHLYTARYLAERLGELGASVEIELTREARGAERLPQAFVLARKA